MKPFLYNEVFNPSNGEKVSKEIIGDVPVLIVDNFFENIEQLQEIVNSTPAGNWKITPNSKNYKDYYDCRITYPAFQFNMMNRTRQLIKEHFGHDVVSTDNVISINWFKQIKEKRADFAFPHSDQHSNKKQYTCLVYLNEQSDVTGGTAFFENVNPLTTMENGDDYWPVQEDWKIKDYVKMVTNRLVIFPSNVIHAAYHPENHYYERPRLTLVYWMEE
jgi:hypothetical protein